MAKTNFDDLRNRYLHNQVTEAERVKFEAWLNMMKTEDTTDLEMTDEEEELLAQKIKSSTTSLRDIESFVPQASKRKRTSRWLLQAAAGLLLISVASYGIWKLSQPAQPYAASGPTEKVVLQDGTLVWLRGASKLSYYENTDGRFATLQGEALFEVAKDASRPFTIQYKDVRARVVGTSFSLKTGDSVELKVLTGKVNFSTVSDATGLTIEPFQKASYSAARGMRKFELPKEEALAMTADTEYDMRFKNATLTTVIGSLERKFDVRIKLRNQSIGDCHINLDLTDHSLDSSLDMMTAILNIDVEKNGDLILIAGTGCK